MSRPVQLALPLPAEPAAPDPVAAVWERYMEVWHRWWALANVADSPERVAAQHEVARLYGEWLRLAEAARRGEG